LKTLIFVADWNADVIIIHFFSIYYCYFSFIFLIWNYYYYYYYFVGIPLALANFVIIKD